MAVTHQRIHRNNDVTWCWRTIVFGRKEPLANVVTISQEAYDLLQVRYANGKIDYTPRTREENAIIDAERARLKAATTCKSCYRKLYR